MSTQQPDDDLDASARDLLAAFVEEEQLPQEVRARVWSRLEPTSQPLPAPEAAASHLPWIVGGVLAAAAAVALSVTLGTNTTEQREDDRGHQAPHVVQPIGDHAIGDHHEAAPRQPRSPSRPLPNVEAVEAPPSLREPEPPQPPVLEPHSTSPSTPKRARSPKASHAPEPVTSASSLAEETRLLERARRAVAQDDPTSALKLLGQSAERFPRGVLLEERMALQVVALCDAGRQDAGTRARTAFLRRYPRSALRARVSSACAPD